MGKAKSAKKGVQTAATQPAPKTSTAAVNALETDLASLEESKRQKACMLLADLYSFNISNKFSLDTLTSSSILNKLSMRLVDASEKVRVQGASALKNLSECKDPTIIKRIINLGIVRSAVTLCVETLTGGKLTQPDSVSFAESLLHTLANAISASNAGINEILSANADFVGGLFSMINVSTPADVLSAVANLLIIIAGHTGSTVITGGAAAAPAFQAKMDQLWSFVEALNGMKGASPESLAALPLFAVVQEDTQSRAKQQPTTAEMAHEQRVFQLNVLMVECLEVVINIYAHAPYTTQLAEVCRINRALLLLTLELHTSLNGIEVTKSDAAAADNERPGRKNSTASMDTDASAEAGSGLQLHGETETATAGAAAAFANMKRLGLCKVRETEHF
jgi:outer membrane murein-binding lipoprotein Lpp